MCFSLSLLECNCTCVHVYVHKSAQVCVRIVSPVSLHVRAGA